MSGQTEGDTASSQFEAQQCPRCGEPETLSDLLQLGRELFEYASQYASATTDGMKLSARRAAIRVLVEVGFMLAAASVIVGALTLVFVGIAGGLAEWLGGRAWLGNLLAGLLLLLLVSGAVWLRITRLNQASHRRTVQLYEERKRRQRTQFNRDASEQAATARDGH